MLVVESSTKIMDSSQALILNQTVPRGTFEQLCELWQEMAKVAGEEAIFLSSSDPQVTEASSSREYWRLLVSSEFSALLSASWTVANSAYRLKITFEPQGIAKFMLGLSQRQPIFKYPLKFALTQLNYDVSLPSLFSQRLLAILTPEIADISAQTFPYHHFPNYPSPEKIMRLRLEQERILNQVSLQINQNLDWLVIVKMTIEQVCKFLQLDRLLIYQLNVEFFSQEQDLNEPQLIDTVTYEALGSTQIPSLLHFHDETCFAKMPECRDKYRHGFTLAVNDVEGDNNLSSCLRELMKRLQVRAKIVTPLIVQGHLWGFLIAHQCFIPRQWKASEIKFLLQVADYLAIAIYQAQSYQQLQQQKKILEQQVNKRAQELQDALLAAQIAHESKSEFIGTMSHELRTPLTSIIGLSSTLLHWSKTTASLPADKRQKYLENIHESGKKLLNLINDILDFSQVEAGKSLLNISEFSLRQLTWEILHSLQEEAKRQEIALELDFRVDSTVDRFFADRERLQQILINLLENAIKFTPPGGKVILRIWRELNRAVFQVEDTGIGIPQQQLPLLFKKFQQLEKYRQRTHGGTGLGLALTKQLVELHQGRIEVESTSGKGSLFTVWIPNQFKLKSKANHTSTGFYQLPTPGRTIVLVETDEEVATLICEMLTAAKYQVVWLIDSSTAIRQIELLQPTVVILSSLLSNVNQISQTLKKLKTTQGMKILAVSQNMTASNWQILAASGVDDYLLKPIQPTLLLQKVGNLLIANE